MKKIYLLQLKNYPIFEQLKIEEALLRTDMRSFCIINEGSPKSIVMGISSKPHELIDLQKRDSSTPVIKRFSGGGCVFVDEKTLFVTFIINKEHVSIPIFPEPILRWSEGFYKNALRLPKFELKENDYVIGNHKCGGNAQYIQRNRWLHHTSFLWDYEPKNMDCLLFPKKVPQYRKNRPHTEFICKLKDHLVEKDRFVKGVILELANRFQIHKLSLQEALTIQSKPHRKSTNVEM